MLRAGWNQLEKARHPFDFLFVLNIQSMNNFPTASKIHITSEVNDELQLIGGFKTEPRGLIDVKVNRFFSQFPRTRKQIFIFNKLRFFFRI